MELDSATQNIASVCGHSLAASAQVNPVPTGATRRRVPTRHIAGCPSAAKNDLIVPERHTTKEKTMSNPTHVIRPHAARPPLPGRQYAQRPQLQSGYRPQRIAPPWPATPRGPVPPRGDTSVSFGRPAPARGPVARAVAGPLRAALPRQGSAVPSVESGRTSPATVSALTGEVPAQGSTCRRKRSIAWVYYAILATLCLIGSINAADARLLFPTMLCAAYATYLYRGGRFVFWIW
jgi:hypothetical protein